MALYSLILLMYRYETTHSFGTDSHNITSTVNDMLMCGKNCDQYLALLLMLEWVWEKYVLQGS